MQRYSDPIPHIVIDNFIDDETLMQVNTEWPDEWERESGSFQIKWNTTKLPHAAQCIVDSVDSEYIGELLGIDGLMSDPDLSGAGLHCIPQGGFLKMHVDFNTHPKGWHRRANVLIYLNEVWNDSWGGQLLLGRNQEKSISPIGGRCVIFQTTEDSWHGHPKKLKCPVDVQRRSLAMYFYTEEPPEAAPHSTIYIK